MKQILLLTAMFISSISIAQIPNYEFESWDNYTISNINDWVISGNVSQTTDRTDGNYALRLDNKKNADIEVGFVANTMLLEDLAGGKPYTDIPLVMSFDTKYNLAQGDVGKVIAIFKLMGQPLGSVDFSITGNSADTFINYKVPIQWALSASPDSVIVLFISNDFESNEVNGDGYMILDNIVFETFGAPDDQIDNPSFENWNDINIPFPTGWMTTNIVVNQFFNYTGDIQSVVESNDAHFGSSMLLQNKKLGDDIVPGIAFTGDKFDETFPPAFSVSQNWQNFQGYYKYIPDGGDTANITIIMYQDGNIVGLGEFKASDTVENITYFSTPISYFGQPNADSAILIVTAADFDEPQGENTKLWVDKITFTNAIASVEKTESTLKVFPNPANTQISVNVDFKVSSYIILNAIGEVVVTSEKNVIDITILPSGTYILKAKGDSQIVTTKFIKL